MSKTAMVFGVTGQDGSYLSEILLGKGYEVTGISRRSSSNNMSRLETVLGYRRFSVVQGDICDPLFVRKVVSEHKPDEIYNLAAQSHVGESFIQPSYTIDVDLKGILYLIDAVVNHSWRSRVYQASTSEMFGSCFSFIDKDGNRAERSAKVDSREFLELEAFQDERTCMSPNSPHAVSKLAAHNLINIYRKSHGIFACSGILFNHESPRRGENFVTRKITSWIGRKKNGLSEGKLQLGNISSMRDWGHAEDYCLAMWMMLQNDDPEDFVISTGETHSVEEFLSQAFLCAGLGEWKGKVEIDSALNRPLEVDALRGMSGKARKSLGWKPKINFSSLVKDMVESDIDLHARPVRNRSR